MYNKLVRDRIPDIIKNNGEDPIIRILKNDEYKLELERKLFEECSEVIQATKKERIEELADLLEVIEALAKLENSSIDEVIKIAEVKRLKRGTFNNKIFLENVITKEKRR